MGSLLDSYAVERETEWQGRRFVTARDGRSNQVVYLLGEPTGAAGGAPGGAPVHPNLPSLMELGTEGGWRWWVGSRPEGDRLVDLRLNGDLTETDLLGALLSVLDALQGLAAAPLAPLPAYLDPACILRDRHGRWVLDYLALVHVPDLQEPVKGAVPGIYAFGVLLNWVVTGEMARRTRVQLDHLSKLAPPGVQLVTIRCLGRSYGSLAELRAALAKVGKEREFQPVVQRIRNRAQAARIEVATALIKGPHIPLDDRTWAPAPPPAARSAPPQASGGRGPGQRTKHGQAGPAGRRGYWLPVALVGLISCLVSLGVAIRLGWVPGLGPRPTPSVLLLTQPEFLTPAPAAAELAGRRARVYLDGHDRGEAEIYTSPAYPYMAVADLNRLFDRHLTWTTSPEGNPLLQEGKRTLPVPAAEQAGESLWLKLLPEVQEWLGLTFRSYRSGILHFSTKA